MMLDLYENGQPILRYGRVLAGREIGFKNTITFANMKITSGSLMTRTDRTNSGHVRPVRRHYPSGQTRTHPYRGVRMSVCPRP